MKVSNFFVIIVLIQITFAALSVLYSRFKQNVQNSRVYTTKALATAINQSQHKPKVYVVVTGVGAYEPSDDIKYDESSPTTGKDFFSRLVIEWEKAAYVDPPVRLVSVQSFYYYFTLN